jgi:hypothetical protein
VARFFLRHRQPQRWCRGGDDITFSVSTGRATLGATGGYFGLFNSSGSTKNRSAIVAVELDTMANPEFANTSNNHIGLESAPWCPSPRLLHIVSNICTVVFSSIG